MRLDGGEELAGAGDFVAGDGVGSVGVAVSGDVGAEGGEDLSGSFDAFPGDVGIGVSGGQEGWCAFEGTGARAAGFLVGADEASGEGDEGGVAGGVAGYELGREAGALGEAAEGDLVERQATG
jgi:hypothetical protein